MRSIRKFLHILIKTLAAFCLLELKYQFNLLNFPVGISESKLLNIVGSEDITNIFTDAIVTIISLRCSDYMNA